MSESSRDQQVQAILHSYLQAVDAGQSPDREEIVRQHPAFAEELREFFADQAKMDCLAQSLHRGHALASEITLGADDANLAAVPQKLRYFGDYELAEEIARGAMGVVFKARQVSLNRPVALKMILKGELATEADVQRFRDEAEAAANLDHPNIVPIYEIGEHEGQQYFSMKLIGPGKRRAELGVKETARVLALMARAVHHAHQRGILHRDLKPSNILFDENGEPHVADFGLAKRVGGDSGMTRSGAIVGTPSYMAPEQARAEKVLTTAVDVYSLGAILYEWLTGRPPFRGEDVFATLGMVTNDEPPRPRSLNPRIDRDLETICLKCLHKAPERRYGSAEMLAEDLERWLRGEPITARPVRAPERLLKWARRRPERAVLSGLVTLVLVIGMGWSAWQGWLYVEDRRRAADQVIADQKRLDEQKAMQRVIERSDHRMRAKWNLDEGRGACRQGRLDVGMLMLARGLRRAVAGEDADTEKELRLELGRYAPRLPRIVTMRWNGPSGQNSQFYGFEPTYGISLSRDGKRLIAAGASSICDVDASLRLKPAFTEKDPFRTGVAISPDGSQFVKGNLLCDASTGKLLRKLEGTGPYKFSPDGKRLLSSWLMLLDPATGQAVGTPMGRGDYASAVFSPDSSLIAFVRKVGKKERADVQLWDAIKGEALGAALPVEKIAALAISPDSKLLATAGRETGNGETVRLWDVKTGKLSQGPWLDNWFIKSMAFSPDGKVLLTGGMGQQLWYLDTGKQRLPSQGGLTVLVFFDADGKTFWTVTQTGLQQWDTASGRLLGGIENQFSRIPNEQGNWACGVSADGRRVAVAGTRTSTWAGIDDRGNWIRGSITTRIDPTILVWELPTARPDEKEDPRPMAGTPEQINLWLQAQTGRETEEYDPNAAVDIMRIEDWWKSREKVIADGGLPAQ